MCIRDRYQRRVHGELNCVIMGARLSSIYKNVSPGNYIGEAVAINRFVQDVRPNIQIINFRKDESPGLWNEVMRMRKIVYGDELKNTELAQSDEYDSAAIHFLLKVDDEFVGTVRNYPKGKDYYSGRLLILPSKRLHGLGDMLLKHHFSYLKSQGINVIYARGREPMLDYYKRLGFEPTGVIYTCLLYTSPSPRDRQKSRMPSSA
eukprot:TRINITY_DN10014_c0_g2_i12.p1 TRINITY_DN10014_c0_g2~~TRINITY_DN10014_c0_g2_i12.p1  ORF type:complete len:205 (-),score=22.84 TRINITY_DN10014_c0_g2_i12:14-628(-)